MLDKMTANAEIILSILFIVISLILNYIYNGDEIRTRVKVIEMVLDSEEELIMMGLAYYLSLVIAKRGVSEVLSSDFQKTVIASLLGILLNLILLMLNKGVSRNIVRRIDGNHNVWKTLILMILSVAFTSVALIVPILLIRG